MAQVAAQKTPATANQMRESFTRGWPFERYALTPEIVSLLLALSDFETGTWAHMYNWNPGNIVPGGQYEGPWHVLKDAVGNSLRFRSYSDRDAGARALVEQLLADSRPEWREGLLTGDPSQFVAALGGLTGGRKYYEADPSTYRERYLGRWAKYRPNSQVTQAGISPSASSPLLLIGGLVIAVMAIRRRK